MADNRMSILFVALKGGPLPRCPDTTMVLPDLTQVTQVTIVTPYTLVVSKQVFCPPCVASTSLISMPIATHRL